MYNEGTTALRAGRHFTAHHHFHITMVTDRRQTLFQNKDAAKTLIEFMRYQHDVGNVKSFAFVIMPDHVHWLIESIDGRYDRCIQQVKSRTSRSLQRKVWQRNYFDKEIQTERQLHQTIHYILRNPIEAKLTHSLKDYPYWGLHADWIPDWIFAEKWTREWGELRQL